MDKNYHAERSRALHKVNAARAAAVPIETIADLSKFASTYEQYTPDDNDIDPEKITQDDYPVGLHKERIKGILTLRAKKTKDPRSNRTPCYPIIKDTISQEIIACEEQSDARNAIACA